MALDELSWSHHLASNPSYTETWQGAVNILVTDNPEVAQINDRFNSGDGESSDDWLLTHQDDLVLLLADSPDGVVWSAKAWDGDSLEDLPADLATKYLPNRMVYSESNEGQTYPLIALALDGGEAVRALAADDVGDFYSPAGGDTSLPNGWHLVGFSVDGAGVVTAYADGEAEPTTSIWDGDFDQADTSSIGGLRDGDTGNNFDDRIGRVLVFNEPLTAAERASLYTYLQETYDLP